ncbi:TrbI/VirB10 family protein [Thiomicrorhabdus aquaedulcis]|uniref:TrbI/VirB10 family protein n=1 Tax=Thiomicrorhabdus aquaedulcis TaxID=2211106 RepID=UPI000FD7E2D0|nr:TrbI/VirB10 family protein [Thiomicrorhabdus aquaedulcis]
MANLNNAIKKKQYILIGGLLSAIVGGSMLVVYTKNNTEPKEAPATREDVVIERYSGIGSNVDEDEIWRATSSNQIDELKKQNTTLEKELKGIRTEIATEINKVVAEKTAKIQENLDDAQRKEIERIKKESEASKAQPTVAPSFAPPVSQATPSADGIQVTRRVFERNNPAMENPGLGEYEGNDLFKDGSYAPAIEVPKLHSLSFNVEQKNESQEFEKIRQAGQVIPEVEAVQGLTVKNYIPAGTFVRALLLGGLDAPTGGQAQENPYPALLEVADIAKLPNSYEYDFKQCRVIGSGYGDISSERAIIRLEKMSCVTTDERVFESAVKGFVYDETGKVGAKGRLVSKQGQLIANGLMIGIGAGIGNAFKQSTTNYTTSALGTQTESFISAEDAAVAGLGQGVGTTLDRLSRYFIDLAEKIFPVIEVDAGRMIDIVFTSGFHLKPGEVATAQGNGQGQAQMQNLAQPSATNQQGNSGGMGDMTIGDLVTGTSQTLQQVQGIIQPGNMQTNNQNW